MKFKTRHAKTNRSSTTTKKKKIDEARKNKMLLRCCEDLKGFLFFVIGRQAGRRQAGSPLMMDVRVIALPLEQVCLPTPGPGFAFLTLLLTTLWCCWF
jgi:hypothetical protein